MSSHGEGSLCASELVELFSIILISITIKKIHDEELVFFAKTVTWTEPEY